jgi:hypothetical protein
MIYVGDKVTSEVYLHGVHSHVGAKSRLRGVCVQIPFPNKDVTYNQTAALHAESLGDVY